MCAPGRNQHHSFLVNGLEFHSTHQSEAEKEDNQLNISIIMFHSFQKHRGAQLHLHHSHTWLWQRLPVAGSSPCTSGMHGYYTWHWRLSWCNHAGERRRSEEEEEDSHSLPKAEEKQIKMEVEKYATKGYQFIHRSAMIYFSLAFSNNPVLSWKFIKLSNILTIDHHLLLPPTRSSSKNKNIYACKQKTSISNGSSLPHWHCCPLAYILAETNSS